MLARARLAQLNKLSKQQKGRKRAHEKREQKHRINSVNRVDTKQERLGKAKQERLGKAKQERPGKAKQERLGKAKQERPEEAKQERQEEAKQERPEEAKQERPEEAKQERPEEAKQERPEEAKQERLGEAKQERPEEAKQERLGEAKQERLGEAKRDGSVGVKQKLTRSNKQERPGSTEQERQGEAQPERPREEKKERSRGDGTERRRLKSIAKRAAETPANDNIERQALTHHTTATKKVDEPATKGTSEQGEGGRDKTLAKDGEDKPAKHTRNYSRERGPAKELRGQKETYACADGTTFSCHRGTRGCKVNSPTYCAALHVSEGRAKTSVEESHPSGAVRRTAKELMGRKETYTCADGTTFRCNRGTRGCEDNSPTYCTAAQRTRKETYACADGTTFRCHRGAPGCKDNSPTYCTVVQISESNAETSEDESAPSGAPPAGGATYNLDITGVRGDLAGMKTTNYGTGFADGTGKGSINTTINNTVNGGTGTPQTWNERTPSKLAIHNTVNVQCFLPGITSIPASVMRLAEGAAIKNNVPLPRDTEGLKQQFSRLSQALAAMTALGQSQEESQRAEKLTTRMLKDPYNFSLAGICAKSDSTCARVASQLHSTSQILYDHVGPQRYASFIAETTGWSWTSGLIKGVMAVLAALTAAAGLGHIVGTGTISNWVPEGWDLFSVVPKWLGNLWNLLANNSTETIADEAAEATPEAPRQAVESLVKTIAFLSHALKQAQNAAISSTRSNVKAPTYIRATSSSKSFINPTSTSSSGPSIGSASISGPSTGPTSRIWPTTTKPVNAGRGGDVSGDDSSKPGDETTGDDSGDDYSWLLHDEQESPTGESGLFRDFEGRLQTIKTDLLVALGGSTAFAIGAAATLEMRAIMRLLKAPLA